MPAMLRALVALSVITIALCFEGVLASAKACTGSGEAAGGLIDVGIVCAEPGIAQPSDPGPASPNEPTTLVYYRWASTCTTDPLMNPGDG